MAFSFTSCSSSFLLLIDLQQSRYPSSLLPLLPPAASLWNKPSIRRRAKLLLPALLSPVLLYTSSSRSKRKPRSVTERRTGEDVAAVAQVVEEELGDGEVSGVVEEKDKAAFSSLSESLRLRRSAASADSISLGIKEPVYEVVEVKSDGMLSTKRINRRQLLKSSGLRPRDIRSVDPSLWLMNSMPSLLVREHAILLNLGSLRAIAMHDCVLIFDYNRRGGKAFLNLLLPRLSSKNMNSSPAMPFELEVVEAALISQIQRLEQKLMDVEPRVVALLEVLPNRLTADVLEQLRLSKQTLVELGSRAGAFKQMLLDLIEDTQAIRRICIMGRNCTVRGNGTIECSLQLERQISEEEEEEIEMLLETYLQRCESCHGQAERLLDSAREMEDSISVNLRLCSQWGLLLSNEG